MYLFCGHLNGRQFLSDFVILTQKPWLGRSFVLTMVVWLNLHGDQLLSKHLYLYHRVKIDSYLYLHWKVKSWENHSYLLCSEQVSLVLRYKQGSYYIPCKVQETWGRDIWKNEISRRHKERIRKWYFHGITQLLQTWSHS